MSNNTSSLFSPCEQSGHLALHTVISYLYFILFPIALLLNGVAACVSLHLRSTSTFIVYFKNLVGADLLMTLTAPVMAASHLPDATVKLKVFACRYTDVIFYCSLYTSIILMSLISLDRFFKIVRPCGKLLGQSVMFSTVMSTSAWFTIFGTTAIPTMILTNQDPSNNTRDFCMSMKSPLGRSYHDIVILLMEILFWLASILIVFCYICITMKVLESFRNSGSNNSQGKKRTKLRVFCILIVFFLCFVPLHALRIPLTLYGIFGISECAQTWLVGIYDLALWLSTMNACLDPLLYIYLCREFRDKLVEMMKGIGICVKLYSVEKEENSP
ncbi:P2Y purinoceptor 13-like [Parambassis ranga]|uniref:P2Y purinoceptor 13-like n=1 Tax=Parambassis ranga TaxID=210632 RepID=A0A6P7JJX9_9TELE|nr:P2Y purinoceptor 13-like [Parambassis ranga]